LKPEDLTVVIPTRDRWEILGRTLDALRRQSAQGFETVVVVDGDDQQPPPLPGVRVIVKPHGGPGAARNAGVHATSRPLVLFLGDDMVPTPDLIAAHLRRHTRSPEPTIAVLGHVEWHPEVARSRLLRWLDWSSTQFEYQYIVGEEAGFGRFYSCNVSLKRQLYLEAGGFDEEFVYYYEDLDFGWRLNEHGMRLLYEPAALAEHLHSYDWPSLERRFAGVATGERLMSRKHAWFTPFFAGRVAQAQAAPRRSWLWTVLADIAPPRPGRVRRLARSRANAHYYQRLAPAFLSSWDGSEERTPRS
jgi:GT2 family glycosyltransferase